MLKRRCCFAALLINFTLHASFQFHAMLLFDAFFKGLATTSIISLRSWKVTVDRVLGTLLPMQLCEEMCALMHDA